MITVEEQIADIHGRVKKLEQNQVKVGSGTLSAADPNTQTGSVDLPDGTVVVNVPVVGNYIPEEGQIVHFLQNGLQPIIYPPTQPIVSAPPSQASGVTVLPGVGSLIIRWAAIMEANVKWNRGYYQVQVDTVNTFSSGGLKSVDVAGTSCVVTDLTPGTLYYVRVRGVNYQGTVSGSWSTTASQTAGSPAASTITGQITNTQIADDSITSPKIAANTIQAGDILGSTITAAEIAANAITTAQLNANAVTAAKLSAISLEVGKYIRSTTYSAGSSGWTINADGSVEFNNITARGTIVGTYIKGSLFVGTLGPNIAVNPDAEVSNSDWQFINCTGTRTTTAGEFRSGVAAFKMTATSGGSPYMLTYQQPIENGMAWSGICYTKAAATARSIRMRLKTFDSGFTQLTSYETIGTNMTGQWRGLQVTSNGPLPSNAVYIQLEIMALSAAGSEVHFFDDISIFASSTMYTDIVTAPGGAPRVSIYSDVTPQILMYTGLDGEQVGQIYRTIGLTGQTIDITEMVLYSGYPAGGSASSLQLDSNGVTSGLTRLFRVNSDRAYLNDGSQEIIMGVHADTNYVNPSSTSTTSTTPVEPGTTCRVTSFKKRHASSDILVMFSASCWTSVANPMTWFVNDGTTNTQICQFYFNNINEHMTQAGQRKLTGLAAGTYTFQLRWQSASSGQTLTMDANDHMSITIMEVSA